MRRANLMVFDEYLKDVVSATLPVTTTSQELNAKLGTWDQLGLFAVVDNASANGGINVQIEHSSDGRNWVPKNTGAEIIQTSATFVAGETKPFWGGDTGANPSLAYLRLRIWFSVPMTVHVKIFVTGRDMAG